MRVLIIGAGIVGYTLAEQLSREKHDIYVIEKNPEIIREMNDSLDVFGLCASGCSEEALESIGIQDMDLVIAVTNQDEVNILSLIMASQYGVKRLVTRVKNPEYVQEGSVLNKENTGIDLFINPSVIVVEMIERLIEVPGCTDVAYIRGGEMQVRGFELNAESSLVGKSIRELRELMATDAISILAITRGGKTEIPSGDTRLTEGDAILVLLAPSSLPLFLPFLKQKLGETKKIVLFGSTKSVVDLAKKLEGKYEQVILLEPDRDKCEQMTKLLKKTLILQGSALEKGTLKELVVETVDVFACLSEKDEDNYMAAMMAKQYGAKRVIVQVEKPAYLEILDSSNIDIVINPRLITVSKILQFLRRGKVLSAAKLMEGDAEVLEYFVEDDSPIVGKRIRKLREKKLLPAGCRFAVILEKDGMVIPDGDTVIQAGQTIVLFVLPQALEKVQDLFSAKKWKLV